MGLFFYVKIIEKNSVHSLSSTSSRSRSMLHNNQQKTEELIDTAFSNLNPGKIILPLLYATEESN